MSRTIDIALASALALLVLAKLLAVPPEFGVPASFAAALANGLQAR